VKIYNGSSISRKEFFVIVFFGNSRSKEKTLSLVIKKKKDEGKVFVVK
jgi:hypothetical protein